MTFQPESVDTLELRLNAAERSPRANGPAGQREIQPFDHWNEWAEGYRNGNEEMALSRMNEAFVCRSCSQRCTQENSTFCVNCGFQIHNGGACVALVRLFVGEPRTIELHCV